MIVQTIEKKSYITKTYLIGKIIISDCLLKLNEDDELNKKEEIIEKIRNCEINEEIEIQYKKNCYGFNIEIEKKEFYFYFDYTDTLFFILNLSFSIYPKYFENNIDESELYNINYNSDLPLLPLEIWNYILYYTKNFIFFDYDKKNIIDNDKKIINNITLKNKNIILKDYILLVEFEKYEYENYYTYNSILYVYDKNFNFIYNITDDLYNKLDNIKDYNIYENSIIIKYNTLISYTKNHTYFNLEDRNIKKIEMDSFYQRFLINNFTFFEYNDLYYSKINIQETDKRKNRIRISRLKFDDEIHLDRNYNLCDSIIYRNKIILYVRSRSSSYICDLNENKLKILYNCSKLRIIKYTCYDNKNKYFKVVNNKLLIKEGNNYLFLDF